MNVMPIYGKGVSKDSNPLVDDCSRFHKPPSPGVHPHSNINKLLNFNKGHLKNQNGDDQCLQVIKVVSIHIPILIT